MRLKPFIITSLCALALSCLPPKQTPAQFTGCLPAFCNSAGGFAGSCTQSTAFINRALVVTPGLDATHKTAYDTLICGLVTDGVFSKFDALYIYATQTNGVALLSLVSASYNQTSHGSPTFTVDRGFTGVAASTTVYLDTGFIPSTAPSPQFTQNSAHVSVWSVINVGAVPHAPIGLVNGAIQGTLIYPETTDTNAYFRANSQNSTTACACGTPVGFYLASRNSSATITTGYKNGSLVETTNPDGAVSVQTSNILTLAANITGSGTFGADGSSHQLAEASLGSGMSGTDDTNFYNRLRTYMTTVGVP